MELIIFSLTLTLSRYGRGDKKGAVRERGTIIQRFVLNSSLDLQKDEISTPLILVFLFLELFIFSLTLALSIAVPDAILPSASLQSSRYGRGDKEGILGEGINTVHCKGNGGVPVMVGSEMVGVSFGWVWGMVKVAVLFMPGLVGPVSVFMLLTVISLAVTSLAVTLINP